MVLLRYFSTIWLETKGLVKSQISIPQAFASTGLSAIT